MPEAAATTTKPLDHPLLASTTTGTETWEWVPADWPSFQRELDGIIERGRHLGHLLLFRGQRERTWLLDTTFARACKTNIFGVGQGQRLSQVIDLTVEHRRLATERLLFKFGDATRPSARLLELEATDHIDPWFEWMKRLQQYPEIDRPHPQLPFGNLFLPGTFLMDWTYDPDIALYFANGDARTGEGALWVVDATATGKTLHRDRSVRSMLDQMGTTIRGNGSLGVPLIFHPRAQMDYPRAARQQPVYVAQMELVYDLAEVWNENQRQPGAAPIVIKLVVPAGTHADCDRHLADRGITTACVLPA